MSSVFVVVKSGVYRHDLCGYSTDLDYAKGMAIAAQKKERDKYHDFDVIEVFDDGSEEVIVATYVASNGTWQ